MAKKKETTSRGVIKDLLSKAWEKVKGKPRSERGTKADVEARELKRIAEKAGRSAKQIKDIASGKRPGKNLLEPLKQMKRGRKVTAPPKEEKKARARKKPVEKPEKPPSEQPPKPPPAEPTPPAEPSRVNVTFKGWIAPHKGDEDYLRNRRISESLQGDLAAKFNNLWESGDKLRALELAVAQYFRGIGTGWLESVTEEPTIDVVY